MLPTSLSNIIVNPCQPPTTDNRSIDEQLLAIKATLKKYAATPRREDISHIGVSFATYQKLRASKDPRFVFYESMQVLVCDGIAILIDKEADDQTARLYTHKPVEKPDIHDMISRRKLRSCLVKYPTNI